MATHSRILAWRIPRTEQAGKLQYISLQSWTWTGPKQLSAHKYIQGDLCGTHKKEEVLSQSLQPHQCLTKDGFQISKSWAVLILCLMKDIFPEMEKLPLPRVQPFPSELLRPPWGLYRKMGTPSRAAPGASWSSQDQNVFQFTLSKSKDSLLPHHLQENTVSEYLLILTSASQFSLRHENTNVWPLY